MANREELLFEIIARMSPNSNIAKEFRRAVQAMENEVLRFGKTSEETLKRAFNADDEFRKMEGTIRKLAKAFVDNMQGLGKMTLETSFQKAIDAEVNARLAADQKIYASALKINADQISAENRAAQEMAEAHIRKSQQILKAKEKEATDSARINRNIIQDSLKLLADERKAEEQYAAKKLQAYRDEANFILKTKEVEANGIRSLQQKSSKEIVQSLEEAMRMRAVALAKGANREITIWTAHIARLNREQAKLNRQQGVAQFGQGFLNSTYLGRTGVGQVGVAAMGGGFMGAALGQVAADSLGQITRMFKTITGYTAELLIWGVQFNQLIEQTRISLTGVIASFAEFPDGTSDMDRWAQSGIRAKAIIEDVYAAALKTRVPITDLIGGLENTLGPAIQAGFDDKAIVEFTISASQAMSALGIQAHQTKQELRSLFEGEKPRPGQDRLGTLIYQGIGNVKEFTNALKEAGLMDVWLNDRMKWLAKAGEEQMGILTGAIIQFKNAFHIAFGEGTQGLAEDAGEALKSLGDQFMYVNEQGDLAVKPELIQYIRDLYESANNLYNVFADLNPVIERGDNLFEGLAKTIQKVSYNMMIVAGAVKAATAEDASGSGSSPFLFGQISRIWQGVQGGYLTKKEIDHANWWRDNLNTPRNKDMGELTPELLRAQQIEDAHKYDMGVEFGPTRKDYDKYQKELKKLSDELAREAAQRQRTLDSVERHTASLYKNTVAAMGNAEIARERNPILRAQLELNRDLAVGEEKAHEQFLKLKDEARELGETAPEILKAYENLELFKQALIAEAESNYIHKITDLFEEQTKASEEASRVMKERIEDSNFELLIFKEQNEIAKSQLEHQYALLKIERERKQALIELNEEAKKTGMNPWTLQRRIGEINTTFDNLEGNEEQRREFEKQFQKWAIQDSINEEFIANFVKNFKEPMSSVFADLGQTGGKNFLSIMEQGFNKLIEQGAEVLADQLISLMASLGGGVAQVTDNGDGTYSVAGSNQRYSSPQQAQTAAVGASRGGQLATAGFGALQIGFGAYQQGAAGLKGSQTAGLLGGAASGAGIGAQMGTILGPYGAAIGAVVGAIVGWIGAALGKAESQSKYKFGQFGIGTVFDDKTRQISPLTAWGRGNKNIRDRELTEMIERVQTTFDEFWNGYINLVMEYGMKGLIPAFEKIDFDAQTYQEVDEASANFLNHFEEWLAGTLPRDIAAIFEKSISTIGQTLGFTEKRMTEIWAQLGRLDPKKQMELLGILFETGRNFQDVRDFYTPTNDYMSGSGMFWWNQNQLQQQQAGGFVGQRRESDSRMVELASAIGSYTGEAQIRAAHELSRLMAERMENEKAYMLDLLNLSKEVAKSWDAMSRDLELQGMQTPEGNPDFNAQINYLQDYLQDIYKQIQETSDVGVLGELNAEAQRILSQILGLANQAGPEQYEAIAEWAKEIINQIKGKVLERIADLGKEADAQNTAFIARMNPYINTFLGVIEGTTGGIGNIGNIIDGISGPLEQFRNGIQRANEVLTGFGEGTAKSGSNQEVLIKVSDSGGYVESVRQRRLARR